MTEIKPYYNGGLQALQKFLEANTRYPEEARKAGVQGKVYVSFTVNKEGKITDSKIMRSVSPLLNDEALRVTNLMKDWNPGSFNGQKVDMAVNMPVEFSLK